MAAATPPHRAYSYMAHSLATVRFAAERAGLTGNEAERVLAVLDDVVLERAATHALLPRCALVGPAGELPRCHVGESAGFAGEV
jgi:hypothetical protein